MIDKLIKAINNPALALHVVHRNLLKFFRSKKFVGSEKNRSESDTGHYVAFVEEAVRDYRIFKGFKRNPIYTDVLEHVSRAQGQEYLEIIKNEAHDLLGMLDKLKINDEVGSPLLYEYPDVGWISPTTLRYIKVAADIRNLFGDLALARIAEIGVGYGGQFLILDQLYRMRYFLYDLPPVLEFASKYLESHILNSSYEAITLNQYDGVGEYDLVISNYAFSELPRQLQQKYIEKIIYKSKRGYLTMNSGLPNSVFKNNKMTIDELRKHLPEFEILEERPNTTPGNYIIVWGHK